MTQSRQVQDLIAAIVASSDSQESLENAAAVAERLAREGPPDLEITNLAKALRGRGEPLCRYVSSGALDAETALGLAIALEAYKTTELIEEQSAIAEQLFAASGDLSAGEMRRYVARLEATRRPTADEIGSVFYWIDRHRRTDTTTEIVNRVRVLVATTGDLMLRQKLLILEDRVLGGSKSD